MMTHAHVAAATPTLSLYDDVVGCLTPGSVDVAGGVVLTVGLGGARPGQILAVVTYAQAWTMPVEVEVLDLEGQEPPVEVFSWQNEFNLAASDALPPDRVLRLRYQVWAVEEEAEAGEEGGPA